MTQHESEPKHTEDDMPDLEVSEAEAEGAIGGDAATGVVGGDAVTAPARRLPAPDPRLSPRKIHYLLAASPHGGAA